jgi:phytoene dehydrogenase-like protein
MLDAHPERFIKRRIAIHGKLRWTKMPENFEKFIYPGFVFDVPSDPTVYRQRLIEAFPHERRAIETYFKDVRSAMQWFILEFMARFLPQPMAWAIRTANRVVRTPRLTTAAYLRRHVKNEKLRAVLTSQWGDYGLLPEQSAFAVHALIVSHYLRGAYYPKDGAERIARIVEEIVEAHGGAFLINSEVTEILTRDGSVAGVRVRNLQKLEMAEYHAPVVISDAGATG